MENRIIVAITISGCSLLLLSIFRRKSPQTESNPQEDAPARLDSTHTPVKGRKQVRFSEDVKEPSKNNSEYRRRWRKRMLSEDGFNRERSTNRCNGKNKKMPLPENQSALYHSICRYHKEKAILMIYV
ncbi:hypothetical protein RJ641_001470 [Dillenia turbinata]|uniref:Uncharacterized protein n=1 Tax=Dillenia turbinata TaxID=194707 RepID=A0AAN8WKR7_9MAGN